MLGLEDMQSEGAPARRYRTALTFDVFRLSFPSNAYQMSVFVSIVAMSAYPSPLRNLPLFPDNQIQKRTKTTGRQSALGSCHHQMGRWICIHAGKIVEQKWTDVVRRTIVP